MDFEGVAAPVIVQPAHSPVTRRFWGSQVCRCRRRHPSRCPPCSGGGRRCRDSLPPRRPPHGARRRNPRPAHRHRAPLRRRAFAADRGPGRRGRRHSRRRARRDARARPLRHLDPGRIRRPRSVHGRRMPRRHRARPHEPGVPLGVRHQCRDRQPGAGDVRDRRAEGQVAARHRDRRDRHLIRPDRTGSRDPTARRCRPGRCATATTMC